MPLLRRNHREKLDLEAPEPDGIRVRTEIPSDRVWIFVVHHLGTKISRHRASFDETNDSEDSENGDNLGKRGFERKVGGKDIYCRRLSLNFTTNNKTLSEMYCDMTMGATALWSHFWHLEVVLSHDSLSC